MKKNIRDGVFVFIFLLFLIFPRTSQSFQEFEYFTETDIDEIERQERIDSINKENKNREQQAIRWVFNTLLEIYTPDVYIATQKLERIIKEKTSISGTIHLTPDDSGLQWSARAIFNATEIGLKGGLETTLFNMSKNLGKLSLNVQATSSEEVKIFLGFHIRWENGFCF